MAHLIKIDILRIALLHGCSFRVDYVTWNGPNADLLGTGVRSTLAKGPDRSLLQGERSYIPKGPNSDLRKGPMRGLAKGSIYSQLSANSSNESRGK
ncbi:hypothetical protein ANN_02243 [Periplaneta americana]|uniref:Uncharacterized protein n=1 Tax=Periplaneta americana TaxID=6978 RepID=A0ABQ8TY83_PERAM|nr:hypothetical protein ANN_02243 [Periplaneta americana]